MSANLEICSCLKAANTIMTERVYKKRGGKRETCGKTRGGKRKRGKTGGGGGNQWGKKKVGKLKRKKQKKIQLLASRGRVTEHVTRLEEEGFTTSLRTVEWRFIEGPHVAETKAGLSSQ